MKLEDILLLGGAALLLMSKKSNAVSENNDVVNNISDVINSVVETPPLTQTQPQTQTRTFAWFDLTNLPSGWYLDSPGVSRYYGSGNLPTNPTGVSTPTTYSQGGYTRVSRWANPVPAGYDGERLTYTITW